MDKFGKDVDQSVVAMFGGNLPSIFHMASVRFSSLKTVLPLTSTIKNCYERREARASKRLVKLAADITCQRFL